MKQKHIYYRACSADHGLSTLLLHSQTSTKCALKQTFSAACLVLLCHKFRHLFRAAQHGQRDSIVARATTNLRRIVAIEFGTWRSGRNGGSFGLVTLA